MIIRILQWLTLGSALSLSLFAQPQAPGKHFNSTNGDFFIISSVDLGKNQILLKLPTEVTELMRVTSETRYFDEHGGAIKLTQLRAGDTVYISSKRAGEELTAVTVSKGPMTLDILRQRYLKARK